jgi:hypothetical protein
MVGGEAVVTVGTVADGDGDGDGELSAPAGALRSSDETARPAAASVARVARGTERT